MGGILEEKQTNKQTNKQKNNEKVLHERGFSKLKASRAKNLSENKKPLRIGCKCSKLTFDTKNTSN